MSNMDTVLEFIEAMHVNEKDGMAEFPVMGTFRIEGKIIRHWRDYFDLKQCLDQLPPNMELPT